MNGLGGFFDDTDWGDIFRTGLDIYGQLNPNPVGTVPTTTPVVDPRNPAQTPPVRIEINPMLVLGACVVALLLLKGGRR